jgi:uncharacterized protein (DUF362 family)
MPAPVSATITLAIPPLVAKDVVTLPKLKTHGLTLFTGGVKTDFGCLRRSLQLQGCDTIIHELNHGLLPAWQPVGFAHL